MSAGRFSSPRSDAARTDILERVRRAQGKLPAASAEREAMDTYLGAHLRGPVRDLGSNLTGDLVARFAANAAGMHSTVAEVARESDAPAAAAEYLGRLGLPARGCVWPALRHLDWQGAGLALEPRSASADDPVGVTGAFAALAETGTLMLVSGEQTPATVSLLPETHIAVVSARRIVPCMEDAWGLARRAFGELPRAVNFISGPSRTGDLEQKMVLGVHGPYRVHVIVVRDDAGRGA